MKKLSLLTSLIGFAIVLVACGSSNLQSDVQTEEVTATEAPDTPAPTATDLVAAPTPNGRTLQPLLANANINLDEVQTLLPPDAIPAILPESVVQYMVTAEEAETMGMSPTIRVLGVSINGDSRAYPIPFMSAHEIVNDEVGGELIAATW